MTSIGLLVLARNEAQYIRRCISSVRDSCEQMIVLDMESEDETADIARSCGAQVQSVPIVHRFDAVRQVALAQLTTDWVIQLDGDEWVEGLLGILDEEGWFAHGRPLKVPKMNHLAGRWIRRSRWWPNYQIRIFPREGSSYSGTFHAHLQVAGKPRSLPASPRYAIRHAGHSSAQEMMASVGRFLPEESVPLSRMSCLLAIARPLAGYVTSGAWRDGSDGLAILAAGVVNAAAKEASRER
jgi:hypothetical protein